MAEWHEVTMVLVRETKGALRYEGIEGDEPGAAHYLIGTLYLRKEGVRHHMLEDGDNWPQRIVVRVSPS